MIVNIYRKTDKYNYFLPLHRYTTKRAGTSHVVTNCGSNERWTASWCCLENATDFNKSEHNSHHWQKSFLILLFLMMITEHLQWKDEKLGRQQSDPNWTSTEVKYFSLPHPAVVWWLGHTRKRLDSKRSKVFIGVPQCLLETNLVVQVATEAGAAELLHRLLQVQLFVDVLYHLHAQSLIRACSQYFQISAVTNNNVNKEKRKQKLNSLFNQLQ